MIRNYLITAFRNVIRYKGFSLINIFGLSLSMSVCMLIIVVIMDQYSYDEIHTKKERIYRIQQVDSLSDIPLKMASNPYALGIELRDNYAIAEKVVILNNTFGGEGLYNDTRLDINGLYTSSAFFDVFDFQLAGWFCGGNSGRTIYNGADAGRPPTSFLAMRIPLESLLRSIHSEHMR